MKRATAIRAGIDVGILLALCWCLGWAVYTVGRFVAAVTG